MPGWYFYLLYFLLRYETQIVWFIVIVALVVCAMLIRLWMVKRIRKTY